MNGILIDVAIASVPMALGLLGTWRLVWPRWKLPGKVLAYFVGVALLSAWVGHWSLLLAYLHQGIGLVFHLWFCRRHGFVWYNVTDPEAYVAAQKAMLGLGAPPPPAPRGPWRAMQVEGEPVPIEHRVEEW